MKKIICLLCAAAILCGCAAENKNETITTSAAENTKAATTASLETTEAAEAMTVEGLEISEYDGEVHVYIPAGYTDENIGEYFRETENVIYEPDEKSMFCVVDRALYSKDMTKLYAVPAECEDIVPGGSIEPVQKSFTVPESVTWIAPNAFYIITTERPLINIYVHEGISEDNIRELVLWGGTYIIRPSDVK